MGCPAGSRFSFPWRCLACSNGDVYRIARFHVSIRALHHDIELCAIVFNCEPGKIQAIGVGTINGFAITSPLVLGFWPFGDHQKTQGVTFFEGFVRWLEPDDPVFVLADLWSRECGFATQNVMCVCGKMTVHVFGVGLENLLSLVLVIATFEKKRRN